MGWFIPASDLLPGLGGFSSPGLYDTRVWMDGRKDRYGRVAFCKGKKKKKKEKKKTGII